jgi:predicted O-methyltransferase YrrM
VDTRYWSTALLSFVRHLRRKEFLAEVLSAGVRADLQPAADEMGIFRAFPELRGQTVPLGDVAYRIWNMDPIEQYFLGALAAVRQPRTIFEIGTFDGATSRLLARCAPEAHVYTLDLPPEDLDSESAYAGAHLKAGEWGSRFHGTPEAARITQLFADSRTFDFSPYFGSVDLVVVDGGHSADCVVPDTENALRMVAPGGVVVWDDYEGGWIDVIRAVDGAATERGLSLVRIRKTGLAVYDTAPNPQGRDASPAQPGAGSRPR